MEREPSRRIADLTPDWLARNGLPIHEATSDKPVRVGETAPSGVLRRYRKLRRARTSAVHSFRLRDYTASHLGSPDHGPIITHRALDNLS